MRWFVRTLAILLCWCAAITPTAIVVTPPAYAQKQEAVYVGSARSNKYHRPSCQWAHKIKPSNLVQFSSPEEAQQQGYVPCKVCHPPVRSR